MHKKTVHEALQFYDSKKGFLRRIFGDSEPIKQLRRFYENHLIRLKQDDSDDLHFNVAEEIALLTILIPEQNNKRLTGKITNNLLKVLNLKLTFIGNLLHKHEIPFPKIDTVQKNKDNLEKIFTNLQSKNRLNKELIIKILERSNHSSFLARMLEFVPNFNTQQLIEMIDSNWYEDNETRRIMWCYGRYCSEEQIMKLIDIKEPKERISFLNQEVVKNKVPWFKAVGRHFKVEIDWKSQDSNFPSRFNLYNFFSAPAAKKEEDPILDWICSAIKC